METYLQGLNDKQKEAVLATTGPVLIVAGAGAGKTKTLTHRMLHIMKSGVPATNILAITFTNKAAREMKERINHMLEKSAGNINTSSDNIENSEKKSYPAPFVSTFHALGVHIMRQQATIIGLPRFFGIYDTSDSKRIVKNILISEGHDPKQMDPAKILHTISREKGNCVTSSQYATRAGNEFYPKIVANIWPKYEKKLREENAVDFDDLLLVTAKLLEEKPEVREYYQKRWQYVHIDEYQDINTVQYRIVQLISEKHHNICAVGDTDQNIYSWRGADMSNMLRFEKDYPEAQIILLEENYRSTKTILSVANCVIKKNKVRIEKNLFTQNLDGEKIGVFEGWSEAEEAFFVTNKVKELMKKGVPLREISVLYRANFQSRVIEEAFAAEGLPYAMVGTKFFERKEIKDVLAFIRTALNGGMPADLERIINIPPRGIGEKTLEKISTGQTEKLSATIQAKVQNFYNLLERIKTIAQTKLPTETIRYVLKETGIESALEKGSEQDKERLENARELVTLAKRYDREPVGEGIELLVSDASLAASEESPGDVAVDAVKLMTVHAAKGLEFDYVFITGLEEGLFPHERSSNKGDGSQEAEEERRLFYVALTRARHKVFLSYASMRTVFGERKVALPSRFLSDVPTEHTELEFVTKHNGTDKPIKTIYF